MYSSETHDPSYGTESLDEPRQTVISNQDIINVDVRNNSAGTSLLNI